MGRGEGRVGRIWPFLVADHPGRTFAPDDLHREGEGVGWFASLREGEEVDRGPGSSMQVSISVFTFFCLLKLASLPLRIEVGPVK